MDACGRQKVTRQPYLDGTRRGREIEGKSVAIPQVQLLTPENGIVQGFDIDDQTVRFDAHCVLQERPKPRPFQKL
jgi:hypothetical protein